MKLNARLLLASVELAVTLNNWPEAVGASTWTIASPFAPVDTVIVLPEFEVFPTSVKFVLAVAVNVTEVFWSGMPPSVAKTVIWNELPSVTCVGSFALFDAVVDESMSVTRSSPWCEPQPVSPATNKNSTTPTVEPNLALCMATLLHRSYTRPPEVGRARRA
jgi:hypothetical protein